MRDDLITNLFPTHGEPIDPVAMARRDLQKKLPKRFYKAATAELCDGAYILLLDGRPAKTPARLSLAAPHPAVAQALVAEWNAQDEVINPLYMPVTRLLNSALDGVSREMSAVRAEILRYAGTDLTCYRAEQPQSLVEAQANAWDPVLDFAAQEFGTKFAVVSGLMFNPQPPETLAAIGAALEKFEAPLPLAALNVLTTIGGSALIALSVAHGFFDAQTAFDAAHVDELYQAKVWGGDDEAQARRAHRWTDFRTAAFALNALRQ